MFGPVSTRFMKLTSLRSTVLTVALSVMTATVAIPIRVYGQARQQQTIPENAIVINLDRNGALRFDQEQIEFASLMDRLHDISATRSDNTVVIVTAPQVAFKELVTTVEAVRAAGIDRVGILKAQPDGSIRESLPPLGATVLSVDRTGVVRLDGKKTKVGDVASRLQKLFKRRTDHTVYVQAYGALSFDTVSNVIDAAKAAGAKPIGLLALGE